MHTYFLGNILLTEHNHTIIYLCNDIRFFLLFQIWPQNYHFDWFSSTGHLWSGGRFRPKFIHICLASLRGGHDDFCSNHECICVG